MSKGVSVLELIKLFEKVNKININYQIGERRQGDIEKIYANCKLAKIELGWSPEKSIEDALLDAWNWGKKIHQKDNLYI